MADHVCPTCDGSGKRPELMLCPFCGKKVSIFQDAQQERFVIECMTPNCANPRVESHGRTALVFMWNTRHGIPPRKRE